MYPGNQGTLFRGGEKSTNKGMNMNKVKTGYNALRNLPDAIAGEDRMILFDAGFGIWGIHGVESDHCYSTHGVRSHAETQLANWRAEQERIRSAFEM
jgi:hypothetical protein